MVEVFIDEQRLLVYSFQLYRDLESILVTGDVGPYIREVMEHCAVQVGRLWAAQRGRGGAAATARRLGSSRDGDPVIGFTR
jgi:hypothetical protein